MKFLGNGGYAGGEDGASDIDAEGEETDFKSHEKFLRQGPFLGILVLLMEFVCRRITHFSV